MSVLILRLAAPLQSWGGDSRYMTRHTHTSPTKSGMVGLLAAALGRRRGADLTDIASLPLGVRADQPGRLLIDYHTVSGASRAPLDPSRQRLPTAAGGTLKPRESTKETRRYYLSDAVFVAAVGGPREFLGELEQALRRPRFPLYLGRRSCPPARPVLVELRHDDKDVLQALQSVPWQAGAAYRQKHRHMQTIALSVHVDDVASLETWDDCPLQGARFNRTFGRRPVKHSTVTIDTGHSQAVPDTRPTEHDPFALLEDTCF